MEEEVKAVVGILKTLILHSDEKGFCSVRISQVYAFFNMQNPNLLNFFSFFSFFYFLQEINFIKTYSKGFLLNPNFFKVRNITSARILFNQKRKEKTKKKYTKKMLAGFGYQFGSLTTNRQVQYYQKFLLSELKKIPWKKEDFKNFKLEEK